MQSSKTSSTARRDFESISRLLAVGVASAGALIGGCDRLPPPPYSAQTNGAHTFVLDASNFGSALSAFRSDNPTLAIRSIALHDKSRYSEYEFLVLTEPLQEPISFSHWQGPRTTEGIEYHGNGIFTFDAQNVGARLDQFNTLNPNWEVKAITSGALSQYSVWNFYVVAEPTH